MASKLVQTAFRIDRDRLRMLRMWALEHDTTLAAMLNEGLDLFAAKHKFKLPKQGETTETKHTDEGVSLGGAA